MQAHGLRIFDEPPARSRPAVRAETPLEASPPAVVSRLLPSPILESVPPPVARARAALRIERVPSAATPDHDDGIRGVLTSVVEVGETVELAFRRKERQLGELFATLSVADAQALHRRLSNPQAGDHVAELFNRMTVERRGRLLTFLADARRREVCRR